LAAAAASWPVTGSVHAHCSTKRLKSTAVRPPVMWRFAANSSTMSLHWLSVKCSPNSSASRCAAPAGEGAIRRGVFEERETT
jgi:hypothetical protein